MNGKPKRSRHGLRLLPALTATALVMVAGCAPVPPAPSGHIQTSEPLAGSIPSPVEQAPPLAPPRPQAPVETFSLVATDVPVKDLLFALARDAKLNLDVDPGVSGRVTINAIDQTLPRILDRIARQADVRFERHGNDLVVAPDRPHLRNYSIDYVNLARDNSSSVQVATQIATTGQGAGEGSSDSSGGSGNNSLTSVSGTSNHHFWQRLAANVRGILGETGGDESAASAVIVNPEAGLLSVRATSRQHARIQAFLDEVLANSQRQVLIEATVVEVELNDDYQFGVDWQRLAEGSNGLSYIQSVIGNNLNKPPFFELGYTNPDSAVGDISATVKMLREFGNVRVLSSPKIMAINNQTAILKVVDNVVYFTIEAETITSQTLANTTFTSTVHTVPVGFVMSVTPQVNDTDTVILNVRPTISRVTSFVKDPNPSLAAAGVESLVPQIEVREMDSVLRIGSGHTAVLGGLIQDGADLNKSGVPVLSTVPNFGDAFAFRNDRIKRSELVVFLRPRVIHTASIKGDLSDYQRYLPENTDLQPMPGSLHWPPAREQAPHRPAPTPDPVTHAPAPATPPRTPAAGEAT